MPLLLGRAVVAGPGPGGAAVVHGAFHRVRVLSCFIGYMVIWNVSPSLHTPLMSVTNAISSIIILGALTQISSGDSLIYILAGHRRVHNLHQYRGWIFRDATYVADVQGVTAMSSSLITVAYLASAVLFILALGGLSTNDTARRGNLFGIIGMVIALVVTIAAFVTRHYEWLIAIMVAGGVIGFVLSRRVQMTQMPELVAILHSLVGLAAVLIGIANFLDASIQYTGVEKTIHEIEIYIGVGIGAMTFTGSVIAYGKLSGMIGGQHPCCCRHATGSTWHC